jgi:hypothetical protein
MNEITWEQINIIVFTVYLILQNNGFHFGTIKIYTVFFDQIHSKYNYLA